DALTERMDGVLDGLTKSSSSMQSVMARIERGEGSLGKFTKDDELYVNASEAAANLKKAAAEMARLTEDIRLNPKKDVKLSLFCPAPRSRSGRRRPPHVLEDPRVHLAGVLGAAVVGLHLLVHRDVGLVAARLEHVGAALPLDVPGAGGLLVGDDDPSRV